jgi:hypothetical protein
MSLFALFRKPRQKEAHNDPLFKIRLKSVPF